ncbi:zinc finger protein 700-like [Mercenaria mercenaria]|uniref:zinc finger protein 700-like n=1 Tax=Mercenaria mercenaria TaxID=6596 RepID=UPI00234EABDA|nr:zinc finger protein 700-like [Mercenaria mercenaria]
MPDPFIEQYIRVNRDERPDTGRKCAESGAYSKENSSKFVPHKSEASLESDSGSIASEILSEEETFSVQTHSDKEEVKEQINLNTDTVACFEQSETVKMQEDTAVNLNRNLFTDFDNKMADFDIELTNSDSNIQTVVDENLNDMDSVETVDYSHNGEHLQDIPVPDCSNIIYRNLPTEKQTVLSDSCGKDRLYSCTSCMRKFDFHCHLKRHICIDDLDKKQSICTSDKSADSVMESPDTSPNDSVLPTSTETVPGSDYVGFLTSDFGDKLDKLIDEEKEIVEKYIDSTVFKDDGQQYIKCKICRKDLLSKRFPEHILTHTKPYRCVKCGQGFRARVDRTNHLRKKHNIDKDSHHDKEDYEAQRIRDIFLSVISRRSLPKHKSEKHLKKAGNNKLKSENDLGIFSDLPADSQPFQSGNDSEQIEMKVRDSNAENKITNEDEHECEKSIVSLEETDNNSDTEDICYSNDECSYNPDSKGPENFFYKIKYKDGFQYASCKLCGKEFHGKRFAEHIFTHVKPFKCKECGIGFRDKRERNMHLTVQHHYPSGTVCSDSEDSKGHSLRKEIQDFLSKYSRPEKERKRTYTGDPTKSTIETMDTATSDSLEIMSRVASESPTGGGALFKHSSTSNSLSDDTETFSVEEVTGKSKKRRAFLTCNICGIALTNSHYKQHMRVHSKPFRCKQCHYATARRKALEIHLLMKHGLKATADDLTEIE